MDLKRELLNLKKKRTRIVTEFRMALRRRETEKMEQCEKEYEEANKEIERFTLKHELT